MHPKNPPRLWLPFFFFLAFFSSSFGSYPQQTNPSILPSQNLGGFEGRVSINSKAKSSKRRPSPHHHHHHHQVRVKIVNVDKFGAKGDGRSDDTRAFGKAWKAACNSSRGTTQFVVPKNKIYVLKPIVFVGPCRADLTVKIFGTIKASNKVEDYKKDRTRWISFERLKNLRVKGGGTINGNGKIWWQNSCKVNTTLPCTLAPNAVTFEECTNLKVTKLRFENAQQMHLSFNNCTNVRASHLLVNAPWNSPNTDGVHVTHTRNIHITRSLIKTGDDCISIVSGSKNVKVTDITCGPGHGISIGSLGAGNATAEVSDVLVNRATISGTSNGVRIKTWQGGSGYARNIKFQHIVMKNVSNPIIINQNYCDQDEPCQPQASAVKVSNVVYKNIRGTSATKLAIKFECSESVPCEEIVMQDVSLMESQEEAEDAAKAECVSVDLTRKGIVTPLCSPT